ncbi:netrin receptor unc-40-like isoform X2 [Dysidea avara]
MVICSVPTGSTVTEWLRDGTLLDIDNNERLLVIQIGGGQFYRLVIMNIQQSDSGHYQCRASSNQLSPMSGYVNVIFIQITALPQQQLVYQTDSTVLCSSVNDTLVNWFTGDGDPIVNNGTYSIEDDGLHITSVQLYHHRQYECEHTISGFFQSRTVTIDVTVVVPSMVLSAPSNMSIRQDSDFSISFNYLAIPLPNFTWYINDVIYQSADGSTTDGTHTMMFTSASEEGWYRCVVQNEFGRAEYSVFVDLLVPPTITSLNDQVVAMGTSLVLNCLSQGDVPLNYQWRFSGGTLDSDDRVSGLTSNTLTITEIIETDNGTYTCRVENDHGMDIANAVAIVIGTPDMLSDVSSSGITSTTALVTWTITTNTINRPVDHIIVQYHISNSSNVVMVNVSADMTGVILEGLIPNTLYTFNVAASNLAGNSPFSSDKGFLTPRGAPKIASETGSSSAYNSVQLSVTLQYDGGSPITAICLEFRVAGTTNILSEYTRMYPTTQVNATATSWEFTVTGLQYEENGYEVIVTPFNSIGQGVSFVSQPIILFTAPPGKPNKPLLQTSSVKQTSLVISCSSNDLGQPPLNMFIFEVIKPTQRNYSANLVSYSAGTLVSIIITNLTSGTNYTFACYAGSVVGVGEESDQTVFMTSAEIPTTTGSSSIEGNILGIIIGAACAITLILLSLSLILAYYSYRKRRKYNTKMSIDSPNNIPLYYMT